MKKLLISLFAFLGIACLPMLASAAYNDVQLGSVSTITVNSVTMNILSTSLAETVLVGDTTLTLGLQPNSTTTVTVTGRNALSIDGPNGSVVDYECLTGMSLLNLSVPASGAASTVVITPSSAACDATGQQSTGGGGGGGGGGSSAPATPATPASPGVSSAVPATPSTNADADAKAKVASLLEVVRGLQAKLGTANSSVVGAGVSAFAKTMMVGSKSSDVTVLQKILNSDTDTMVASTGAGSPGKETTLFGPATKAAIQKFQVKYGLAKPGDTGYGNFGPKTKAKVIEVAKLKGL